MRHLSLAAQSWIVLILLMGAGALLAALGAGGLATLRVELDAPALWVLLVAASVAHAFPVIAPRHQAYHATQAFLMAAVLVVSWPAVVLIVMAIHVTEWLRRRRPWYIQLYNIAVYLLACGTAELIL